MSLPFFNLHIWLPSCLYFCLCLYKPISVAFLLLQSLQILTPNTDAHRLFTETIELAKPTSVCRRNWRSVREAEEEGKWRTAPPLRHRRLAAAPQRWTFTTVSEGKCWRQSRGSSAMQRPALINKQAGEKTESQEVRGLKGRGLSRFTIGPTTSVFYGCGECFVFKHWEWCLISCSSWWQWGISNTANIILDCMNSDCSLIMEFNTASWWHQCIIKELMSILKVEEKEISPLWRLLKPRNTRILAICY